MSKAQIGRKHTKETKEKIRQGNLGKIVSEETRAKMRGPKSEEHKAKLSKAMKGCLPTCTSFKKGHAPTASAWKSGNIPYNKGKKRSQKTRDKISKTRKERLANGLIVITEETKYRAAKSRTGQKRTEETKLKMSLAALGEKSSQWKGGIAAEPYCDIWLDQDYKNDIKDRDNNECQNPDCWHTSNKLCLHHINYDKMNCNPWNIITVCFSCNSRANVNREYWIEFYQNIMIEKYEYIYKDEINKAA